MAERRMFAKAIVDSDSFVDMPLSAQALYFHLGMNADDEGFVGNPRKITRSIGASDSDYQMLIDKRFVLTFKSGIAVVKHWRINNYIQSDRFKGTAYVKERDLLDVEQNKAYTEKRGKPTSEKTECIQDVYRMDTQGCIQDGYGMDTQYSIGKDSIVEDSIENTHTLRTHACEGVIGKVRDEFVRLGLEFPEQEAILYMQRNPTLTEDNCLIYTEMWAKNSRKRSRGTDYDEWLKIALQNTYGEEREDANNE